MSEHTTSYKVWGQRARVPKKSYPSRIAAEEHAAWWEHECPWRDLTTLQAYHCRVCSGWHLGRKGRRVFWWDYMSAEEYELYKARRRIYWALWRMAHGLPVHQTRRRKKKNKLPPPGSNRDGEDQNLVDYRLS